MLIFSTFQATRCVAQRHIVASRCLKQHFTKPTLVGKVLLPSGFVNFPRVSANKHCFTKFCKKIFLQPCRVTLSPSFFFNYLLHNNERQYNGNYKVHGKPNPTFVFYCPKHCFHGNKSRNKRHLSKFCTKIFLQPCKVTLSPSFFFNFLLHNNERQHNGKDKVHGKPNPTFVFYCPKHCFHGNKS